MTTPNSLDDLKVILKVAVLIGIFCLLVVVTGFSFLKGMLLIVLLTFWVAIKMFRDDF